MLGSTSICAAKFLNRQHTTCVTCLHVLDLPVLVIAIYFVSSLLLC